jgi:hypothetical protein
MINNKLSLKYITFDISRDKYVFAISRKSENHLKRFKTLEEAIEYRNNYLSSEE